MRFMKIQSIAMHGCKKPSFCGDRTTKGKGPDRAVTVRDLNAMEKRIKAHNKALIDQQNDLLGEALFNLVKQNEQNHYAQKAALTLAYGRSVSDEDVANFKSKLSK